MDWYAKDDHVDNGKFIQQQTPLEHVWIDEKIFRNCRHEMENQRRRHEDCICEKNPAVPDIIILAEENNARPPTGAPVSDDESSVHYLLGHPPTE